MERSISSERRAGLRNGKLHHTLSAHWQAENERKAAQGVANDRPLIAAYWQGYTEGMTTKTL